MTVAFRESPRSSVGIEWELHIVDAETGELTGAAERLIELTGGGDGRPIRKEYLPCAIEIVSEPRVVVADAVADLRGHLHRLLEAAASVGVALMGAGSHPFSRSAAQASFRTARYDVVTEKNGWWGRQMAICGTHVHIGVADREYVPTIVWTLAQHYPHLLAPSAASPFWGGEDSGFASQRTMMFQQISTNGLPFQLDSWAQFEQCVVDLLVCGAIDDVDEVRWDVRPSPKFGTIETRIGDSAPTLAELAFQAALAQCLGERVVRRLEAGDPPETLPSWIVRENKWRAARYGLDAMVVGPGRVIPARDALGSLLAELAPVAADLGCADELAFGHQVIDRGASYERQRRVADQAQGDLRAVAAALVAETAAGTPAW